MIRKFVLSFAVLMFTAMPAWAASCYTRAEAEAEQAIRIHSELMVIGLNCQHSYKANGRNLYAEYRRFTSQNVDLFAGYEDKLLDYFERIGAPNPEAKLNTLRTQFANKISTDAATMRPDMFCYRYAPRIEKVSTMDRGTIRKWAATFYPSHPVSQPICEQ